MFSVLRKDFGRVEGVSEMPAENYYCPDNFFKKMTDLDSPKKNNDCYFYYYSTCAKGDNCTFRHEPSALGCETMCSFWKEGKCLNVHCNFRHMELRKNRKAIPCYWESQPVGCLKAHCPFLHQNPRPSDDSSIDHSNLSSVSDRSVSENMLNDQLNQQNERKVTAVDSLVVNFEEESDNESGPSNSPNKNGNRIVTVKTLEEIKLEKIHAEAAAYYSYFDQTHSSQVAEVGEDLRQRIFDRMILNKTLPERIVTLPQSEKPNMTFITTLNPPKRRLSNDELANILGDESLRKKPRIVFDREAENLEVTLSKKPAKVYYSLAHDPNRKVTRRKLPINSPNLSDIKIKTLAEIRAEKQARALNEINTEESDQEVTSTSMEENPVENNHKENSEKHTKNATLRKKIKLRRPVLDLASERNEEESDVLKNDQMDTSTELCDADNFSGKAIDEHLLLESDDDDESVTLKVEEELLNDFDD
ncbi:uncharacterized protein isoform X1 [Leptinotarsa decemlineata]|uniref:uncharacterized protein isoform X1 n=2 Tax=Leptinotarsa decemlineata TaxID=7539 RepID=UPI003D30748E